MSSNNYPPVPSERAIAEARGVSVAEVRQMVHERNTRDTGGGRETRNRGMTEDERHANDLAIARDLQAQFGSAVKPVSQRSSMANRVAATDEARFNEWLATSAHGRAFASRALGEATGSVGGFTVPPRFSSLLIHFMQEYSAFISGAETLHTPHGEAYSEAGLQRI